MAGRRLLASKPFRDVIWEAAGLGNSGTDYRLVRSAATLAYSGLGAVLVAAFLAAPPGLARSVVFDAAAPIAALGIVCGILLYKPPCRRAWGLASTGILLSGGGDILYDVQTHFESAPGLPSLADVFFLAGYVFFLAGLLVYARDEERNAGWSAVVDAAIVSAGTALLLWSSMPAPERAGSKLASGLLAAAYPTADVLLLVIVASLLFSRTRRFTVSDALLLACIALLLAADVLHAQLSVYGAYVNGSPVDVGWLGAYLLAGAAGIHPSVSRRRRNETTPNRRLAGFRAALSAAGMVAPAIVLGKSWPHHDYAITVPAAGLSALVLVRVVDLLRRNDRLRHLAEGSENRFRALVGDVDAIVWEADAATFTFQFVSRRAELLLGYPTSVWTEPEFWTTHVHPDDREWATAYRTSATAERRDHELEYRMRAADGRIAWLRDSVRVVLGADGRPERLRGVIVDVTARRHAEAELERERSLLGATLEATGDGILVIDHDGTVTAFNSQFAQMWQVPEDVLATRSSERVLNFLAGKVRDPDAYLARVGELCTHPNTESSDLVELSDGRFFLRYSKPQLLAGEIVGRVRSFRDVTEQVAAVHTVRESARRFQEALENVPLAALAVDTDGEVVFVNDFLVELAGWSRDELLGQRWSEIFAPADGSTADEFAESTLTTRDGRIRLLSWASTPLHGSDGTVNGVARVGEDITDRRAAEEALRHSEERFRVLTENTHDVVTIVDAVGTIVYQSPAIERVLGYRPSELVGRSEFDLVHPDDLESALAAHAAVVQEPGGTLEFELRLRHRDGSWRWLSGSSRNVCHEPAVAGIVVNARDVTELRESQEQLLHAQKLDAVGRLAGGVAHDFNNLLTAIRGYAELLLLQLPRTDPLRADAEEIARAGERAAALTRQLLAFSRRQMLQPMVLELNQVVEEIENLLRRLIGEDVELVTLLDGPSPRVKADPGQLEQVLVNLAVNARDAMPAGGTLTLGTGRVRLGEGEHGLATGLYAVLWVRDTGVGMDEETQSHLFEPFFTTKERGKGTGLGLATAYGIVKQSGGEIVVESEPGRGARFSVYLPQVAEPAEPERDSASRHGEGAGSETVLLVEDEGLVRALARRVLEQQGYTVLETAEAPAALELCAHHAGTIDLLLTDVVMPKMNGCELAQELTSTRPELRVLYTSGYNEEAIGQHGVTDLGGAFLSKPFTPASLARKVREILDSST